MNNDNNLQGSNVNNPVNPVNNNVVGASNPQVTQQVQPQPIVNQAQNQGMVNQVSQQPVQAPNANQAPYQTQMQQQVVPPQPQVMVQQQQPIINPQPQVVPPQPVSNNQQIVQPQVNNQANGMVQQVNTQPQQAVASPTQTPQANMSVQTPTVQSATINNDLPDSKINFVSEGTQLKKKMNPTLKGIITSAIVAAVVLLGYFVIYPFIVKTFFHNPKTIFDKTIDDVTKYINVAVNDWYGSQGIVSTSFKVDSNYESLKDFSGYTYGLKIGYDSNNKDMELGYSIIDPNKQEYSLNNYIKNKSMYSRYSNYRDLIYIGNIDSDIDKIYSIFKDNSNSINEVSANDINYIINKISNDVKDSIKKDRLVKKDATINVNGKSVKAIKSSYTMNKNDIVSLKNSISNDLLEDDKVIDILARMTGEDRDKVKELLKSDDNIEIDDNYTISFSIYTYGNSVSFVGFDISDSNDKMIKYYTYNDEIDASINNLFEENLVINSVKKDKKSNVNVKYGDKNVLTMVISTWEDNKKVFDFILDYDDQKLTGSIDYEFKQNSGINTMNIEFKAKIGEYYANIELEFSFDKKSVVANVNVGAAKTLNSYELEGVESQFNELINTTPIKLLFQTSSGFNDPSINNSVYKLFYQWLTNEKDDENYYKIDVPDDYYEDDNIYDYENSDSFEQELSE